MSAEATPYTGRFAPSPTGPLHAGSLVAALASYLDARAAGGKWLLRIDDIDPPRAVPGSVDAILEALDAHGLKFNGPVLWQSQHASRYDAALDQLAALGLTFHCRCTRASLAPGSICIADCKERPAASASEPFSIRVAVPASEVTEFNDVVLGKQQFALGQTTPNFILRRRDGLYAYQLACAVDDAAPAISHVIRGVDLLESTHRQRYLHQLLDLASPTYGHVPVVTDTDGNKLSKQTGAPALNNANAAANLRAALQSLNQPTPDTHDIAQLLTQASRSWRRRYIT